MPSQAGLCTRFLLAVKMSSAKKRVRAVLVDLELLAGRGSMECVRKACPYIPGTEQKVHENGQPRDVADRDDPARPPARR